MYKQDHSEIIMKIVGGGGHDGSPSLFRVNVIFADMTFKLTLLVNPWTVPSLGMFDLSGSFCVKIGDTIIN